MALVRLKKLNVFLFFFFIFTFNNCVANNLPEEHVVLNVAMTTHLSLPSKWSKLQPVVIARVKQKKPKMKLSINQVQSLNTFLEKLILPTPELLTLQNRLPKTTLELLRSVESRNVLLEEAEKMAAYLSELIEKYKFQKLAPFDENTSHIIGREWQEIDYSGENMTWQKQREKYRPYGITNFKSLSNLKKFFPVESKLPYFKKTYRPIE